MKKNILILLTCIVITTKAQLLLRVNSDSLSVYNLEGGDEFNQKQIDEDYWSLLPWPKTNIRQFFSFERSNVVLENGLAKFLLTKVDSVYRLQLHEVDSTFIKEQQLNLTNSSYLMKYNAGIVISKQKLHYGLYELRFRTEQGKGVWPAFWFFGGDKNEEIDVFELKGEKGNQIHVDTHCPYGCGRGYKNKIGLNSSWGGWVKITHSLHDGFNSVMLDWRPNEIIWYINGYPMAYFHGKFNNPMNLYINTQVSSKYSAFRPGPDSTTTLPNTFMVDYLRIWKSYKSGDTIQLKLNPLLNSNMYKANYLNKTSKSKGVIYNEKKLKKENGIILISLQEKHNLRIETMGKLVDKKTKVFITQNAESIQLDLLNHENYYQLKPETKSFSLKVEINGKIFLKNIHVEMNAN